MPLGINRTDLNTTGITYKDGFPITLPHNFGNPVDWLTPDPAHFGNPIPSDGHNVNTVNWQTPNPAHFGNIFGAIIPSGDFLLLENGTDMFELEDGSGVILLEI